MNQTILGIIEIIIGGACVIFRDHFARLNAKFQKDNFNIELGDENNKATILTTGLFGLLLLVLGMLTLIGIIDWGVQK